MKYETVKILPFSLNIIVSQDWSQLDNLFPLLSCLQGFTLKEPGQIGPARESRLFPALEISRFLGEEW